MQDRATVEPLGRPARRVAGEDAVGRARHDARAGEEAEPDLQALLLLELAEMDDH